MKKILFTAVASILLSACSTQVHVQSNKTIKLEESIDRPLILAKAGVGLYQKIGVTGEYELYEPVAAERRNFTGNKHQYIGVIGAGTPDSLVCLPDSMNFFHCSKKKTSVVVEEGEQ
ncbi:hypothetical protein EK599_10160 [Vibrio sp. T187]|uniref:lipoprotein n=1 Tax=Vibrio TaxID=662 RepID=UPI0010C98C42|nr:MULTISPECIES: membrane lipoprotein lipid attachment site-containing protein [Vibrio]MBW3696062.1 hypothetical protein [Vibrio sp. T187]